MLNLFSAPILSKILKLNTKKLAKYCTNYKKNVDSVNVSNRGGWQSPPITGVIVNPILNNLINAINQEAEKYRKIISYKYPLRIISLWININDYKDYNVQHTHPQCVASGVYYLTQNNSEIVFINPALPAIEYDWGRGVIENYNEHNSATWRITPVEDQLLIFPSWLAHRVESNLSKNSRISISFNLAR